MGSLFRVKIASVRRSPRRGTKWRPKSLRGRPGEPKGWPRVSFRRSRASLSEEIRDSVALRKHNYLLCFNHKKAPPAGPVSLLQGLLRRAALPVRPLSDLGRLLGRPGAPKGRPRWPRGLRNDARGRPKSTQKCTPPPLRVPVVARTASGVPPRTENRPKIVETVSSAARG